MGDLTLFLPEMAVLLGLLVAFFGSIAGVKYRTVWELSVLAAIGCLVVAAFYLDAEGEPFFSGIYKVDLFSQLLKVGLALGLLLTLAISGRVGSVRQNARADLPIFLFTSTLGMMMLVSSTELLTLYVALEMSAYALYIMAVLHKLQRTGSEAGAKYILFGGASSAVTLYGISLIFGATQSTYLADIVAAPMTPLMLVGLLLAISGLAFKLALFPFHAWAPDTYEGAPHQVVTFIGTASKVAAIGVMVRILTLAGPDPQELTTVLLVLCVTSMTVGNLAAIVQKNFKRMLAYSTVAHAGYVLVGLVSLSQTGMAAGIFYGLIYMLVAFCALLVVCAVGDDGHNPTKASVAGLYERSPLLALVLLVGIFGLAGIPPTPGFAGKWFLFSAAMEQDLFWLVLVAAINSTVSLYYYMRWVKEAYLTPPGDLPPVKVRSGYVLAAYATMGLVVFTGFYPGPLWELAQGAAQAVLGG